MGISTLLCFDGPGASTAVGRWREYLAMREGDPLVTRLGDVHVLLMSGDRVVDGRDLLLTPGCPAPDRVVTVRGDVRLGDREVRPTGTEVRIGPVCVGDGSVAVFAGPCAVESREQLLDAARAVAENGAVGLRGGAYKPRTSPWTFQGLGPEGLALLADVRGELGIPVVTEVLDVRDVDRCAAVADALQVGARNMQNVPLLRELGRAGHPVVLKRGFGCTVDEFSQAAEYLLLEGNDQVVLCERGIRTFEGATRFTLDLSAAALLGTRTHLPVMVDPSHAVGLPELVEPMSLAAVAVGVDALLLDVHADPSSARCDGKQALLPEDFARLTGRIEDVALATGRKLATRSVGAS